MEEIALKPKKVLQTPEEKKEKRRVYQREYMRNRYHSDKDFADKQRELKRVSEKIKYDNSPEYRKHKSDEYRERYNKYRMAFLEKAKIPEE